MQTEADESGMMLEDDIQTEAEARQEFDLPELADTMEEADARLTATRYLTALKLVEYEMGANDAELRVTLAYYKERNAGIQGTLGRQQSFLRSAIRTLFGFMRPAGKKKSLNLLGGRVGMRGKQDELIVEDDDAVIAWAKEHHVKAVVRTKPAVDRKALRTWLIAYAADPHRDDPQKISPPPGVRLEERDDEFFATPAND